MALPLFRIVAAVLFSLQCAWAAGPAATPDVDCVDALEPTAITGTEGSALRVLPAADRKVIEALAAAGEFDRWHRLPERRVLRVKGTTFEFIKVAHAQNQIALIINMHHYVLPLVASVDGGAYRVNTGDAVTRPYRAELSLSERVRAWLHTGNRVRNLRRVAAVTVAGGAIVAGAYYFGPSAVDWYDDYSTESAREVDAAAEAVAAEHTRLFGAVDSEVEQAIASARATSDDSNRDLLLTRYVHAHIDFLNTAEILAIANTMYYGASKDNVLSVYATRYRSSLSVVHVIAVARACRDDSNRDALLMRFARDRHSGLTADELRDVATAAHYGSSRDSILMMSPRE